MTQAKSPVIPIVLKQAGHKAQERPSALLTKGESNTKTAKHPSGSEIKNAILHLAPGVASGYEACIYRSVGCTAACLYSAGRGRFTSTQAARIRRTRWLFEDEQGFMALLVKEIGSIARSAERNNLHPAIRLNGTSDIDWTKIDAGEGYLNIFHRFPNVQFYDYTKNIEMTRRLAKNPIPNYHLTFSLSEGNDRHALEALRLNVNVAVVMDVRKGEAFPASWSDMPVIDGDLHDFRFLDPSGVIVGLRPKGDAKKDNSAGFVRAIDEYFEASRDLSLGRSA